MNIYPIDFIRTIPAGALAKKGGKLTALDYMKKIK